MTLPRSPARHFGNQRPGVLLDDYDRFATLPPDERAECLRRCALLESATRRDALELLGGLLQRRPPSPGSAGESLLAAALAHLARMPRWFCEEDGIDAHSLWEAAVRLYCRLGKPSRARHLLLVPAATQGGAGELAGLADVLADDPPADFTAVGVVLAPLFRRRDVAGGDLFPRLLDGLVHPAAAVGILDLAGYLTREGRTEQHPAAGRVESLAALLGEVTGRLGKLEDRFSAAPEVRADAVRQVAEGVPLAVALCDAIGLIGNESYSGKLYGALELGHRRIRTEAAAALARFGEQAGIDALLEMAAEPSERLRAIQYAQELGLEDKIEEQFSTPAAKAEAEAALYLSQREQFGIPPTELELLDERTQHWPGYEEPVACFLFCFRYRLGEAVLENVAIAGPLVHAFSADLTGLEPEDQYAAFAGWQAQHEDIYELDAAALEEHHLPEIARWERRLRDDGYSSIQPALLGFFFGDRFLAARAQRGGEHVVCVADASGSFDFSSDSPSSIGPVEAACVYKGRRLLDAFN